MSEDLRTPVRPEHVTDGEPYSSKQEPIAQLTRQEEVSGQCSQHESGSSRKRRISLVHFLGFAVIFGIACIPLIKQYADLPSTAMDGFLLSLFLPFVGTGYSLFVIRRVFPNASLLLLFLGVIPIFLVIFLAGGIVTLNMPRDAHVRMAVDQLRPVEDRVKKVQATLGHPPDSLCKILEGIGRGRPNCLRGYKIHYWHDTKNFAIIACRGGSRFFSPCNVCTSLSGHWRSHKFAEVINYDRLTEGLPVRFKDWPDRKPQYTYQGEGKWSCP